MIVNNYRAMNTVRGWKDEPLTSDRVLQLHRIVTDGTLDNADAFRKAAAPGRGAGSESVRSRDGRTETRAATTCRALPARLRRCASSPMTSHREDSVHPAIRSILLHFWLAYDHPFEDGNGRPRGRSSSVNAEARILAHREFLSISTI